MQTELIASVTSRGPTLALLAALMAERAHSDDDQDQPGCSGARRIQPRDAREAEDAPLPPPPAVLTERPRINTGRYAVINPRETGSAKKEGVPSRGFSSRVEVRHFSSSRPAVRPRTALIVEDDEIIRETLAGALEDEGFEVMTASTLGRAHYILFESRHPIGVVVLDLGMPDGDGETLVEALHARDAKSTPVVLLSAMSERGEELAARFSLQFVSKPFDLTIVAATVLVAFENDVRPQLSARGPR